MNGGETVFEQMASRITNLVHPEKIVHLSRDNNHYADEDLLLVILSRLGRGKTRSRYAAAIYDDMFDFANYPQRGVDILVRTTEDMEKDRKQGGFFSELLNTKGYVLYERSVIGGDPDTGSQGSVE